MRCNLLAMLQQQPGGGYTQILFLFLMIGIFYFLLILPQQRRQKKWRNMLGEIKNGDRVVTGGGIHGTIIALRDEFVHLRVPPDNIKIEIARSAIVTVVKDEPAVK